MFVVFLCCPLTNRPLQPPCTIVPLKAFFPWKKGRHSEGNRNNKKKPTQMDMIAGLFSLPLALICSLASLCLGLIRLHVEMEAIEEDSLASDESVRALIALIKRAVLYNERNHGSSLQRWPHLC